MNQLQKDQCREDLMLVCFFPHSAGKCLLASTLSKEMCGARKDILSRGSVLRNLSLPEEEKRNSNAGYRAMQVIIGK